MDSYVAGLVKEIGLYSSPATINSVYIGGGSPSLLNASQLSAITGAVAAHFTLDPHLEFTLEMNPEDVTMDKLQLLKDIGVNRLSIGTQSFVQQDLDYLKRTHSIAQSLDAVQNALKIGFTNLNIDFIISLPNQTRQSLEQSFALLHDLDIPHISAYILEEVAELENEENLEQKIARDVDCYFFTRDVLTGLGYVHYEVSNFCKPGFCSRHNLKYWKNEEYLGIGLSAAGFVGGVDYKNTVTFERYYEQINAGQRPQEELNHPNIALRKIITGLRLLEGIPVEYFKPFLKETEFLLAGGILVQNKNNIAVQPDKILVLNEILAYFL